MSFSLWLKGRNSPFFLGLFLIIKRWLQMILKARLSLLLLSVAVVIAGCGGGGGSGGGSGSGSGSATDATSYSPTAGAVSGSGAADAADSDNESTTVLMLSDIASKVMVPAYQNLASKTALLSATSGVESYCSAIGGADEASKLESIRTLWNEASDAYAKTEVHSVGPADIDGVYRYRVSSFASAPLDTCGVDTSVVNQNNADFNLAARPASQRGLGAVEYLLFNNDQDHSCSSNTAPAGWDQLGVADRKSQRCEYAVELASDIDEAANGIVESWSAEGSNYMAEFTSEDSAGESLQQLTDAIIVHMDKEAKDKKVGIPTGVKEECSGLSCPDKVERPHVQTSLAAVRANIQGFIDVINGGDGKGFDDLLSEKGYASTSEDMLAKAQAAIDNIDAAKKTLFVQAAAINDESKQEACTNAFVSHDETYEDYSACALTGLLKDVTDILKVDFVAIVEVNLPGRVQADND